MKLLKKIKKSNNEKGFTLVELIVVLVILAILAAILVPALLGYIDESKKKQIVLDGKSCLTAAQAELSSMYAADDTTMSKTRAQNVLDMADSNATALVIGTSTNPASLDADSTAAERHQAYTVTYVYYKCDKGEIYFNGSSWVDSATAPAFTIDVLALSKSK